MTSAPLSIGEDTYLGRVPETPFWNKAMAMMIADGTTGVSGALYISRWWGKPEILLIVFALPDVRAVFVRSYKTSPNGRRPHVAGFAITPSGNGTIRYSSDNPMDLRI